MNATQSLITTNFTISHAKQTIKSLRDQARNRIWEFTDAQIKEQLKQEGSPYEKLRTVFHKLDDLLNEVSEVETIIHTIDN